MRGPVVAIRRSSVARGTGSLRARSTCGTMGRVSMDEIETVAVTDLPDDFSGVTDSVLLDVRENYEWEEAHVRGALHIPLDDVPGRIDEIDLDTDLLVICRTSGRSFRLSQYLAMRGIDATVVRGGMVAWQNADKAFDTGTEGMDGSTAG